MPPKIRTAPRKAPRQRRSQETVATILDAAARVLVREGYDRATTNRIAKVASISVGSLYQYFPNKESLVAALAQRHSETMWAVYEKKVEVLLHAPLEVAAEDLVRTNIAAHAVEPRLHKVLMEEVPRVGALDKVDEIDRKLLALMRAYLEARKDEIVPKDLEIASFVIVKLVQVISHGAAVEHPDYLVGDRLVNEMTAAILGYLLGADRSAKPDAPSPRMAAASDAMTAARETVTGTA